MHALRLKGNNSGKIHVQAWHLKKKIKGTTVLIVLILHYLKLEL